MGDNLDIGHFGVGIKLREDKRCLVNHDPVSFAFINENAETRLIKLRPSAGTQNRWHIAKVMHGNTGHVHFAVQMIDNDVSGFVLMQSGAQFGLMNDPVCQVFNHPGACIMANGFGPQLRQVIGPHIGCRRRDIDGPLAQRV